MQSHDGTLIPALHVRLPFDKLRLQLHCNSGFLKPPVIAKAASPGTGPLVSRVLALTFRRKGQSQEHLKTVCVSVKELSDCPTSLFVCVCVCVFILKGAVV